MGEVRLLATVLLCLTTQSLARHLGDERVARLRFKVDVDNTSTDGAESNDLSSAARPIDITVNVHVTNGPNFTQIPELISDTVNRFFSHVQNGHHPWFHLELTSHETSTAPDRSPSTSSIPGTPSPQTSSPATLLMASPGSSGQSGVSPPSPQKPHDSAVSTDMTSTPPSQRNPTSPTKMEPSGSLVENSIPSISTSPGSSTTILPTSSAPQTDSSDNLPETTTQPEAEPTAEMASGMFRG